MNVLIISEGYAEEIARLVRLYKFTVQVYSNPELAYNSLPRVAYSEYLGFAFIDDVIKNPKSLRRLLNKINIMCAGGYQPELKAPKKRFVFAMHPIAKKSEFPSADSVLQGMNLDYVDVLLTEYEILTDVIIRRDVFGSLLLDTVPFEKKRIDPLLIEQEHQKIQLNPLFDRKYFLVFEPLVSLDSDFSLKSLKEQDTLLYLMRLYRYKRDSQLLDEIRSHIEKKSFQEAIYYKFVYERLVLL